MVRPESPQETRLRLLLVRSGLPVPVAQHVVRHGSRFVARVDFAWPQCRLALEYDGAWHGEREQFARDRERLNRLLAVGRRVVFVTARDLHRPQELLAPGGRSARRVITSRARWSEGPRGPPWTGADHRGGSAPEDSDTPGHPAHSPLRLR